MKNSSRSQKRSGPSSTEKWRRKASNGVVCGCKQLPLPEMRKKCEAPRWVGKNPDHKLKVWGRTQPLVRAAWSAVVDNEAVVLEGPLGWRDGVAERWATTWPGGWFVSCFRLIWARVCPWSLGVSSFRTLAGWFVDTRQCCTAQSSVNHRVRKTQLVQYPGHF